MAGTLWGRRQLVNLFDSFDFTRFSLVINKRGWGVGLGYLFWAG